MPLVRVMELSVVGLKDPMLLSYADLSDRSGQDSLDEQRRLL